VKRAAAIPLSESNSSQRFVAFVDEGFSPSRPTGTAREAVKLTAVAVARCM
jgi:hypothetical protein